jgi:hypothetical protein
MKSDVVAMLPDCVQGDREMCRERGNESFNILDGSDCLERQFLKFHPSPKMFNVKKAKSNKI